MDQKVDNTEDVKSTKLIEFVWNTVEIIQNVFSITQKSVRTAFSISYVKLIRFTLHIFVVKISECMIVERILGETANLSSGRFSGLFSYLTGSFSFWAE